MKRILVTGSSTEHVKHWRIDYMAQTSAARALVEVLRTRLPQSLYSIDNTALTLKDMDETANTYDLVIVGLDSPWPGRSRYTYQVAAWAARMAKDPELAARTMFLVACHEPHLLPFSYAEGTTNTERMFSENFLDRPEAFTAFANAEMLLEGFEYLANEAWPTTLVATAAWHDGLTPSGKWLAQDERYAKCVPFNVDKFILDKYTNDPRVNGPHLRVPQLWYTSRTTKAPKTLFPKQRLELRGTHLRDFRSINTLSQSTGFLMLSSILNNSTYWHPLLPLALVSHAPVVADITETSKLGDSWAITATDIEKLGRRDSIVLSDMQRAAYYAAAPDENLVVKRITDHLKGTST